MESRDEETLELKETYSSLQQEVDVKTKKLKKVAPLAAGSFLPASASSLSSCSSPRSCLQNFKL